MSANPIGLIILAVVALIGIIVLLVKHFDKVKAFFIGIGTAIANFFKKVVQFVKDNAVNIVNIVLTILFPIAGIIMALIRLIIKHWDSIKGVVAGVVENIKAIFFSMVDAIKGAWQGFVDFFSSLFSWIGDMASGVWNRIRDNFVSVFESIKEKFFGFINVIKDGWEKVKGVFGGVVNFFTGGGGNENNGNNSGGGTGGGSSTTATSQPFVQAAAASAAARNTYNNGGATQTINSTASISVNVPPGTSTEQAQAISRQVDQAMKNSLAHAINGSRGTIPSPEARRY